MAQRDKQRAVLDGARAVFGRDGYSRANIDAIATEAGVSTRTLYNHFGGKAGLFEAVITDGATRVADHQVGIIEDWCEEIDDLAGERVERALVRLAVRLARTIEHHPDHFALVRWLSVEAEHLPVEAVAAWRTAGPDRVTAARTKAVSQLIDRGLLTAGDPADVAHHLVLLTDRDVVDRSGIEATRLDDTEVQRIVTRGVQAFLYGYRPRS